MRRLFLLAALVTIVAALLATETASGSTRTSARTPTPITRLTFGYDAAAPLGYVDRGRINPSPEPLAVHDVSFRAGGGRVPAYLVVPAGARRRPAVVLVPGDGGSRSQLLAEARWLAARNVVTLSITPPSTNVRATPTTGAALLAQARKLTVGDVVAVRRAVDLLQSLPAVDSSRIGYLGWSLGGKTGTYVAAEEPRVKALVLLSAGADRLSAFVASAPVDLRPQVRRVLGSVDPIRYIGWARSGSVLLEDGTKDEVVPRTALLNIARAAPAGTTVRWYDAPHALDRAAYRAAFAWLAAKLPIDGPPVAGAATA